MKGLFDEEGRKKAAHVVVFGAELDDSQPYSSQAIERRIEELLRRISEKVKPIGGN